MSFNLDELDRNHLIASTSGDPWNGMRFVNAYPEMAARIRLLEALSNEIWGVLCPDCGPENTAEILASFETSQVRLHALKAEVKAWRLMDNPPVTSNMTGFEVDEMQRNFYRSLPDLMKATDATGGVT